ncbi:unnamed protein product [Lactuca saligna]|uniref:Uncharacterized protein n=1 Tax=Lactuca saligna TaxID=75948 RepID=A0AA36E2Y6_LACSI|nr:unnamed protein product [Lactuca saligna]
MSYRWNSQKWFPSFSFLNEVYAALSLSDIAVASKLFATMNPTQWGLPLKLWGDRNFASITGWYGRTIAPFDDVYHRADLSCIKIGIITSRHDRINEEITVTTEEKLFKMADDVEEPEEGEILQNDTSTIRKPDENEKVKTMAENAKDELVPET